MMFLFKFRLGALLSVSCIMLALQATGIDQELIGVARMGNIQKVQALIKKGADINAQDWGRVTVLMWAIICKHKDIVALLLNAGANIDAKDINGWTALMWAVLDGAEYITALLLKYGADVNAQGKDGDTALIDAVCVGYHTIVQLLLDHGADVAIKGKRGKTALDYAKAERKKEIEVMLIDSIRASASKKLSILKKAAIEKIMQQPGMPYMPKDVIEYTKSFVR